MRFCSIHLIDVGVRPPVAAGIRAGIVTWRHSLEAEARLDAVTYCILYGQAAWCSLLWRGVWHEDALTSHLPAPCAHTGGWLYAGCCEYDQQLAL